ncbi:IS3 family transposase [Bacillus sp. FJAT-53060]|nr:IS3 family transposase [Bacillus stratosphericus]
MELFFSHLKTLHKSIEDYIQFYNHDRFQKTLNQCAPVEYRHTLAT